MTTWGFLSPLPTHKERSTECLHLLGPTKAHGWSFWPAHSLLPTPPYPKGNNQPVTKASMAVPAGVPLWLLSADRSLLCICVCVRLCVCVNNQCCDEHCSKHSPRPKWMGGAVDSFPPHITQCGQFCCPLKWREKEGKVLALSGYEPLDQWPGATIGPLTSRRLH